MQSSSAPSQAPRQWFSRYKTRAPKFDVELVSRPRLLTLLDDAIHKTASCVVAPAGYGKSTLLRQWKDTLVQRNKKCAWINLEENDSEFRQFAAYFVFAFEEAGVELSGVRRIAENGFIDMSDQAIVTTILTALSEFRDHIVVVLDDYHRASSSSLDSFVSTLFQQFSDRLHVAIGSRVSPHIITTDLFASGRAIQIDSQLLRFSDREVGKAMGRRLSKRSLGELQARLEGWPVALQMLRLIEDRSNGGLNLQLQMAGREKHMADYLVSNVLSAQADEIQEFLVSTSVLESFNAELANAARAQSDSLTLMRRLDTLQAFVLPLDDGHEWYRYHHLIAECLSERFKADEPERHAQVNRNAAVWCGENRLIDEAVKYAVAANDYQLARQIINDNSLWMRSEQYGGMGYLSNILNKIPEHEILKDPVLMTSKVYACVMAGDSRSALRYHFASERIIEEQGTTPQNLLDRLNSSTALLGQVEHDRQRDGGWLNNRIETADSLAKANSRAYAMSGMFRTILAMQTLSFGDKDKSKDLLIEARANLNNTSFSMANIYNEVGIGVLEMYSNSIEKARSIFTSASRNAERELGKQSNFKIFCDVFLATLDYWQGDLRSSSDESLSQCVKNAEKGGGGYDVFSVGFDAVVHDALCQGDVPLAILHVCELESWTERLAIDRLEKFVDVLKLDCSVAGSKHQEAAELFASVGSWLDVEDAAYDKLGWSLLTAAHLASARYLRLAGQQDKALSHIGTATRIAESADSVLFRVRCNLVKASVLALQDKEEAMMVAISEALEQGARTGFTRAFASDISSEQLSLTIQRRRKEGSEERIQDFMNQLSEGLAHDLYSSREIDILRSLSEGKSNKEIARAFHLSDNTVKFHLKNIFKKLGARNRVNAVTEARRQGVI